MRPQLFSAGVQDTRHTRGSRKRRAPSDDASDYRYGASAARPSVSSNQPGSGEARDRDETDDDDDEEEEEENDDDEDENENESEDENRDDILPANFPAAPLPSTFNLPAYSYKAASLGARHRPQRNLRLQHLAAINAVLHRSLLEGDYARAAHVFAILLRLKVDGRRVDLRKNSLWGIGAEILLHVDKQQAARRDTSEQEPRKSLQAFSHDGFKQAKSFYERLILQFPYRKNNPHSTSELTFYTAMFGIWIFQIQQRARDAAKQKRQVENSASDHSSVSDEPGSESSGNDHVSDGDGDGDDDSSTDEPRPRPGKVRSSTPIEVYASQLRDAQGVADSIANLTRLPPFDRHVPMLQLQTDVGEWMADLSHKANAPKATGSAFRASARETRRRVEQLLAREAQDHDSHRD